jgi:hypothetical protein
VRIEENYNQLSKEELIEKLKRKDEQISEMSKRYEAMKSDFEKEIEKQKDEIREYKYKTMDTRGYEAENKCLKNTIVAMAMYTYPGINTFDKTIREINDSLKIIWKKENK